MIKIKILITSIVFMVACTATYAQNAAKEPTTDASASPAIGAATYIDKFFKLYDKEGTGKAVNYIFKTNKLIDSTMLVGLITKMDSARATIGKYTGKELIMQKKASNSLILYSYLVKHEFDPIRFTFVFYKAKNDWAIYRLYFDNQVIEELQEASKINGKTQ